MEKWEGIRYKHFPNDIRKSVAYQGVAGATVVIEALKEAGPDLTRENFLAAMERTQGLSDHGASCSISFSASSHQGCNDPTVWTLLPDGRVINVGPEYRDPGEL
jgi:branched-chain amino acid transport system substrate-binding protein